jgi:phage terminase small subunit
MPEQLEAQAAKRWRRLRDRQKMVEEHKRKEMVGLESLCALWEQGSKSDSDKATGTLEVTA